MADQGFLKPTTGFATTAIHAGQSSEKWKSAAVVPPIVMSTTFKQTPEGHTGYIYGRSGNPTRHTLEECLAGIEGAKYAYVYSSGLGATTTICSLLEAGDHILSMDDGYGGTHRLLSQVVTRMGIEVSFTDFTKLENLEKNIKKNTKFSVSRVPCSTDNGSGTMVALVRNWLRAHEEAQVMVASVLVVIGLWWLVRAVLTLMINLVCPLLVVVLAVVSTFLFKLCFQLQMFREFLAAVS